jgi:hypothetical protein
VFTFYLAAATLTIVVAAIVIYYFYKKFIDGVAPTENERLRLYKDVAKSKSLADQSIHTYSLYLITKCDTTASCQFEAARRMQKKNMASTLAIIILSLYAILFSLMPTFDKIPKVQANKDLLGMIAIFMSVFIIAFSLYEILKRYDLRSVLFLKSARALQELRDEVLNIHLAGDASLDKYVKVEREYHKILNANDDNHSHLDYDVVRVGKREVVGLRALEVTTLRLLNIWIVPALAFLAPLIIAYLYVYVTASLSIFQVPSTVPSPENL